MKYNKLSIASFVVAMASIIPVVTVNLLDWTCPALTTFEQDRYSFCHIFSVYLGITVLFILPLVSLILGLIAKSKIEKNGEKGKWLALISIAEPFILWIGSFILMIVEQRNR